jgi:hypothetical protein
MTLKANEVPSNNGPKQDPIEPGSYPSRLVQIIDLGLQPQEYLGETKDPKNEIMTTYECSDEFMKDEEGNELEDKPRWISETFTLNSLNSDKAKSTLRYTALDPELTYDGDWSKLLETPATITIVNKAGTGKNKGKVFNNISAVSAMRARDAAALPKLRNEAKAFSMDTPDVEMFLSFPKFVQDKIKAGLEFKGSKLDNLLAKHTGKKEDKPAKKGEKLDDDIPFDEGNEEALF